MKLDLPKLGASLLASGPVLMQLANDKRAWWVGLLFTAIGPFLISARAEKRERKHE